MLHCYRYLTLERGEPLQGRPDVSWRWTPRARQASEQPEVIRMEDLTVVCCVQLSNGIVDVGERQRSCVVYIQRDSGRWCASTDSEGRLTVVNFCFDSTMLCSVANIAWSERGEPLQCSSTDVSQWGWQLHVTLLQVSDFPSVVSRYKESWCLSVGVTATCYIVTGIWWAWWAVTRSPDVSQWGWQLHVRCYIYIVTGIWWAWWAVTRSPDVSQWGWQLHVTLLQVSDERGEPLQGVTVLMSLSGGDSYMLHCYRYLMSVVSRYKASWCLSDSYMLHCYRYLMSGEPLQGVLTSGGDSYMLHEPLQGVLMSLSGGDICERGEPLQGVLMSLSGGDSYMLHCYRYLMSVVSRYKESWCLSVGVTATCYIVTGIWWAWWAVTMSPDVSQWGWQLHVTLLQVSDERGEPLQGVLMSLSGGDSYMLHCYRYLMSVVSRYRESWCLSVGVTATCYIVTGIWWAWWAVTGFVQSWCLSVGVTATCYIVTGIWWFIVNS